jgi:hypothetical protein
VLGYLSCLQEDPLSVKVFALALVLSILVLSPAALAQKADAAFVIGGSFASDTSATFAVPSGPTFLSAIRNDNSLFLEGSAAVRLVNAKLAALYFEIPVAGVPRQNLRLSTAPAAVFSNLSSLYITPGVRLRFLSVAGISPYVSFGGGVGLYDLRGKASAKGGIAYGGGVDLKLGIPFLSVRGEIRDFLTGDPNFSNAGPIVGGAVAGSNQGGLHRHSVLIGGGPVLRF